MTQEWRLHNQLREMSHWRTERLKKETDTLILWETEERYWGLRKQRLEPKERRDIDWRKNGHSQVTEN
jgi:hypothetical protein